MAEPPAISKCSVSRDHASPTVAGSNADAQSICNLTVTFYDRQEQVECNAYEMRAEEARFLASVIEMKNPANNDIIAGQDGIEIQSKPEETRGWLGYFELRKLAGVVLHYETEPTISVSFICSSKYYNSSIQILIKVSDLNEPPTFEQNLYQIQFPEGVLMEENVNVSFLAILAADDAFEIHNCN